MREDKRILHPYFMYDLHTYIYHISLLPPLPRFSGVLREVEQIIRRKSMLVGAWNVGDTRPASDGDDNTAAGELHLGVVVKGGNHGVGILRGGG